jgi:hypothetical protein
MVCVHYEIISKNDGRVLIDNFGWYDSVDSAKTTLKKKYPAARFIVKIK